MSARIGVVGLGTMGTNHATRLVDAGAEIVSGVDVNEAARKAFEEQFDAVTYTNHSAMYESDLDGIVITVPNALHEEVAVTALDENVHTLVEKPLAHSVESAQRIATAAYESEAFCVVGFVMRYYKTVQKLLALRDEGEFGDIVHIDAHYVRRHNRPTSGWFIDPELAGGGALVDIGVHVLDLALTLLDFPAINGIYGRTRTPSGHDVEDSASAFIRCANDATIGLEAAWVSNGPATREIVVRGTEGGAALDIEKDELRIYSGSDGDPEIIETESQDWLAPEDEAFARAVENGMPPTVGSLEEAVTVQRVLDGVYRSESCEEGVHI
ncbi:Gfo/Idh/MocA family protein [Haladaptatus sp. DFWS20]|uniref:Gfo/Idh/MocA family protein n=1 Tax=Haladaptatus sp. DFWS20 TaxID=3403467 RepID=UPI003EBA620B